MDEVGSSKSALVRSIYTRKVGKCYLPGLSQRPSDERFAASGSVRFFFKMVWQMDLVAHQDPGSQLGTRVLGAAEDSCYLCPPLGQSVSCCYRE